MEASETARGEKIGENCGGSLGESYWAEIPSRCDGSRDLEQLRYRGVFSICMNPWA